MFSRDVAHFSICREIPDNGYEEYLDIQACAGTDTAINYLEHVQAKMTIQSKRRGDLVITLTSPMGTRSTILPQRPNDGDCIKGFNNWKFLSTHFWGENPAGRWKLEIGIKKNAHSYFGGRCSGDRIYKISNLNEKKKKFKQLVRAGANSGLKTRHTLSTCISFF